MVLLKLAQVRDHYCVFKVRHDHGLEHAHIIGRELPEAIVHQASQLTIPRSLSVDHFLNVVLTFLQVVNDFFKVFQHQSFVGEQLLCFHQVSNLILRNLFAFSLLQDSHRVKMVLTEKDDVQTSLLKLCKFERKGTLSKHCDFLPIRHQTQNLVKF